MPQVERVSYDRAAAVAYAERWWNDSNPRFRHFDVDCSNFVSQCLWAGGFPMEGAPLAGRGWWYIGDGGPGDRWSYSWAVAHSLRWYLAQSRRVEEKGLARELLPGDVISYDFDGDDRWEHSTVVVGYDDGEPLVNAHTDNSRQRPWAYLDSPAYTPRIQYRFWHIRSALDPLGR